MGLIIRNIEYGQEIQQSRTAGKSPWQHVEKPHTIHKTPGRQIRKAISSLFPSKVIGN